MAAITAARPPFMSVAPRPYSRPSRSAAANGGCVIPCVPTTSRWPFSITLGPSPPAMRATTFGRPGYLKRALTAGASGFVVKETPAAQLADAVRRVHQGLRVVDPALAMDSLTAGDSPLTARETDVLQAARDGASVAVEPDRAAAIAFAVDDARRGDVVVIAGKGHEAVQIIGDRPIAFDDRVVARDALRALRGSGRW